MALVTGLTKERMLEIEDASIVSGEINGLGHLILTTHGGDEVDAGYALVAVPDASTTVKGVVELATQAETEAHTDTARAVTPSALASSLARVTALETEPGERVQTIAALAESDPQSSYPVGMSLMNLGSGSGWSINSGFGTVVTANINATRCVQTLYSTTGGTQTQLSWFRTYHSSGGGGGWTAWAQIPNTRDTSAFGMVGEIKMWPTSTIPNGWLLCDGAAISRATYAALYTVLGNTYGAGNGTTTFNLPNTKGRSMFGYDSSQTEFDSTAEAGGAKTHTLTTAEMPNHTHIQDAHGHLMGGGSTGALTDGTGTTNFNVPGSPTVYGFKTRQPGDTTATNQTTGGGGAHNNLPPYLVMRFIIKT